MGVRLFPNLSIITNRQTMESKHQPTSPLADVSTEIVSSDLVGFRADQVQVLGMR
jgi:hypothetical protein